MPAQTDSLSKVRQIDKSKSRMAAESREERNIQALSLRSFSLVCIRSFVCCKVLHFHRNVLKMFMLEEELALRVF